MQRVKPQDLVIADGSYNDPWLLPVLGIDAAFANVGFARMLLDIRTLELSLLSFRTVSTEPSPKKLKIRKNSDDLRRARELHTALHEELAGCALAFAEIPSGAQAARAALGFGVAVGVLSSVPQTIPLIEVQPLETKIHSVGSKTAEKPEIIAWAAGRYPGLPWKRYAKDVKHRGKLTRSAGDLHDDNEHVADACAVVYAGIQTMQFRNLLLTMVATASSR